MKKLKTEAIDLLKKLIKTPSFSKEEDKTADLIEQFLHKKNVNTERLHNNIIAKNKHFDASKKTLVLNSHHDTVKINEGWTYDPFSATEIDEKIIGLGSNDAGGALVALIATFIYFYEEKLNYNLVLIASGEEENGGANGVKSVLQELNFPIHLTVVGEPTEMQPAIAEKGLLVIDAIATGEAGHAARPNGKNAIDKAVGDIQKINVLEFSRVSPTLGSVVKSVTQIEAGYRHNVIPDACRFVIDVRVNECYELEEVFDNLQNICQSKLTARSFRNRPSGIDLSHPLVQKAVQLGLQPFGSPTLSDQVNFRNGSLKIGPGKSERSHQADEFIYVSEIEKGIDIYVGLLGNLRF
ncbi:MAG: acetylornithine deacetylase [Saprospiraceae bacterium]|jgi:acetylornithine deacetylase